MPQLAWLDVLLMLLQFLIFLTTLTTLLPFGFERRDSNNCRSQIRAKGRSTSKLTTAGSQISAGGDGKTSIQAISRIILSSLDIMFLFPTLKYCLYYSIFEFSIK